MSLPRYPEYKDSGVEWLGTVPAHWDAWKIRHAFGKVGSGTTPPSDASEWYLGGTIPWVTTGELRETVVKETAKYITQAAVEKFSALRLHPKGSLAIAMYGATIGRLGILGVDATTNQACCVLSSPQELTVRFVFYWLLGFKQQIIDLYASGGGQPNISQETISSLRIPAPNMEEQAAIATFLDHETGKIDALIAEQEKLIALLAEKRQATISHAVTKGLNPDVPMKDSGVAWLGEVPAHWAVKKMKWVAEMESGHTPDKKVPAYWDEGDIPWVSLNDTGFLKDNDYISETAYNVTQQGIENSSARLLPPRVVVFSRDATIGRCAITTRPMAVSQHFIAWVCGDSIVPEYLLLRLRSMTQELDRLTSGATLKTIGMPDVRTLVTPVPPLEEQRAIIDFISSASEKLDALSAEAQCAAELLKERRVALISAAVTGKIDVRKAA